MPVLTRVGRGSPNQVAARAMFYALLTIGAICIVYPLLLVFGQAMSDRYDLRDNRVLPHYFTDRNELALKHIFSYTKKIHLLASRHHRNEWTTQPNMREDRDFLESQTRLFTEQGFSLTARDAVLRDFNDFKQTVAPEHLLAKEFRIEDEYRPFLKKRFGRQADSLIEELRSGSPAPDWLVTTFPDRKERRRVCRNRGRLAVAIMNHEFRSDYLNLYAVEVLPPGNLTVPVWRPRRDAKTQMWLDFVQSLPPERKWIVRSDTYWHDYLRTRYNSKIDLLNQAWGTQHAGFFELRFPFERPTDSAIRADWERFVIERWPRRLLRVPAKYAPQWQGHVRQRPFARANRDDAKALAERNELQLPATRPENGTLSRLWCEFTSSGTIPAEEMILDAPELAFPEFLRERYGDVTSLNAAWQTAFKRLDDVSLPIELSDYVEPAYRPTRLRWRHAVESFQRVSEYLVGRGRAIQNTIVLVVLSLCSALTINPLAAYSLSRFTMRRSHKILIYFLATMAFPAEVTMIPNFLLLRKLHLLNTYAALVLPTMANGFSIFLLKCFFDSLPRELFEAAEIDGAGELQIFRLVALPMLKPILAYIGLNTFVLAYSGFMWAFVICPEQHMWTLMVWVYDFQSRNPGANYVMASVLLVSLPPLIVFLLANRIIMKGIIIPSMK